MGKKLYVGNLPYGTSQADLETLFAEAGSVESVNLITDRYSGQSRGFGFVEMTTDEEAKTAIERFDGYDLNGRPLKVNEARPMGERSGGGRSRGGGGGGGYDGGGRDRRW